MPPSSSLCSTEATWMTSRVSSNGLAPGPAVGAVAVDPHGDLRPGRAAQVVDGLVEAHVERRLAVDLDDAVVLLDARAAGRRARHRVHDGELLVADRDDDAEAAELALRRAGSSPCTRRATGAPSAGRACGACRCRRRTRRRAGRRRCRAGRPAGRRRRRAGGSSRPRGRSRRRRGTSSPACRRGRVPARGWRRRG